MSIVTNGTTIPEDGDNIIYDGVVCTQVVCNGAIVWERETGTHTLTIEEDSNGYGFNAGSGALVPNNVDTPEGLFTIVGFTTNKLTDVTTISLSYSITPTPATFTLLVEFDGGSESLVQSPFSTAWNGTAGSALSVYMVANVGLTVSLSITAVLI